MTDSELAKRLREYPNLLAVLEGRVSADAGQWPMVRVELRGALTALLALLQEADACMTLAGDSKRKIACRARLRAVLPEEGR